MPNSLNGRMIKISKFMPLFLTEYRFYLSLNSLFLNKYINVCIISDSVVHILWKHLNLLPWLLFCLPVYGDLFWMWMDQNLLSFWRLGEKEELTLWLHEIIRLFFLSMGSRARLSSSFQVGWLWSANLNLFWSTEEAVTLPIASITS